MRSSTNAPPSATRPKTAPFEWDVTVRGPRRQESALRLGPNFLARHLGVRLAPAASGGTAPIVGTAAPPGAVPLPRRVASFLSRNIAEERDRWLAWIVVG